MKLTRNIIPNIVMATAGAVLLSSCNKYLDEMPSKTTSVVVSNTGQLDLLLNGYTNFYTEGNRTAIYGTDDYEVTPTLFNARPATFGITPFIFSLWDIEYLPDDTREGFWSGEWRKIFNANLVLSQISKVTGSDQDKARLKAEAHFIRAYSYFQLANTYCLPYTEANKAEMGLPIKVSTSFEESTARATLEETYALIDADLEEALKIQTPLIQEGKQRHWRANIAAVNGFAARYYLVRNNYEKALTHANAALAEHGRLVDYRTEMSYGNSFNYTINAGTPSSQLVTVKFPYTHNNQTNLTDMLEWKEFMYFRMLNHESWWYVPSQELLDLYDQANDLRYEYHIVEGYSYDRGIINPSFDYPGYVFFFKDRIPSGPTTAEMLLIKAECQARTTDPAGAMTTINQLREKRMKPGAHVNLTAANKDEAIKKVLEERRREMPFVHRWMDVRRYNNNADPNDDVILTKTFYSYNNAAVDANSALKTYTLPKDSRRFAVPLPRTELVSSMGVIKQNTY